MTKRLTWFISGALAGIAGVGYAKRKVRYTAATLAPGNVAKTAISRARERGHDVADAVRDGRRAMHDKEAELRARRDGTVVALADELEPNDLVFVDGEAIEPGKVIVLRQIRGSDQGGPRRLSRRTRRGA